jgi:hypothetical protein
MYSPDGYVFVAIMSPYRTNFAGGDLLSGTLEQEAKAEETFLSCCGPVAFRGDTIIHYIEISSFPNWTGVDHERLVEFGGNRVTLSTHTILIQGEHQTAHLIWERVSTSKQ